MAQSGISYDQGPHFAAPLYFFLTAPIFLLLAAGLGLMQPDWLINRWSPTSLALTHLITLGFLASVMVGALLQMLPVVLGAPVPMVRRVAWMALLGLNLGTPSLVLGFLLGEPVWLLIAVMVLTVGLTPFLIAIAFSLIRTTAMPHVAWPLRLAGMALMMVLLLGILLASAYAGIGLTSQIPELTAVHSAWGLIGWVLTLVIGVAYQVVPMLQLTPAYPAVLTRWLTWILLAGLLFVSAGEAWVAMQFGSLLMAASSIAFALATLSIQKKRRRQVPDVTLDFWRLGMGSLILAALLFLSLPALPLTWIAPTEMSLGIIFLLGFATSVVSGMLYKIVPFLAWLHLKTQTGAQVGSIPNMKELMPENRARQHWRLHQMTLLLLIPAPCLPAPASQMVASAGLVLLAAGAIRLWLNLMYVKRLFLRFGGRLA